MPASEIMHAPDEEAQVARYVVQFAPLVKRLAHHMMITLPASVDINDVIQSGMLGLLDAARRFRDDCGAQFETYAVQRIRGAMLDSLRQSDWLPRGLRKSMRQAEVMISKLEQQNGRSPTETELAQALNMPLTDYQQLLQDARGYQLISSEDLQREGEEDYIAHHCADSRPDPLQSLLDDRQRAQLVAAIEDLPEREKKVMGLYYEQDMNLREIGEILGVSESRVCQLHSQAIARLRSRITQVESGAADSVKAGKAPLKSRQAGKAAAQTSDADSTAAINIEAGKTPARGRRTVTAAA